MLARVLTVIQARASSSRLPGKVLLRLPRASSSLAGQPILSMVIERAKQFSAEVVVATSHEKSDDGVWHIAKEEGVECFSGSLLDVFSRYKAIASRPSSEEYNWICRVTADCPMLSLSLAMLLRARASQYDNGEADRDTPDLIGIDQSEVVGGISCELIRRESLLRLRSELLTDGQREHVTRYFIEHGTMERLAPPPQLCGDESFEVNTYQDYVRVFDYLRQHPRRAIGE